MVLRSDGGTAARDTVKDAVLRLQLTLSAGPRGVGTNLISNVYEIIYPTELPN